MVPIAGHPHERVVLVFIFIHTFIQSAQLPKGFQVELNHERLVRVSLLVGRTVFGHDGAHAVRHPRGLVILRDQPGSPAVHRGGEVQHPLHALGETVRVEEARFEVPRPVVRQVLLQSLDPRVSLALQELHALLRRRIAVGAAAHRDWPRHPAHAPHAPTLHQPPSTGPIPGLPAVVLGVAHAERDGLALRVLARRRRGERGFTGERPAEGSGDGLRLAEVTPDSTRVSPYGGPVDLFSGSLVVRLHVLVARVAVPYVIDEHHRVDAAERLKKLLLRLARDFREAPKSLRVELLEPPALHRDAAAPAIRLARRRLVHERPSPPRDVLDDHVRFLQVSVQEVPDASFHEGRVEPVAFRVLLELV